MKVYLSDSYGTDAIDNELDILIPIGFYEDICAYNIDVTCIHIYRDYSYIHIEICDIYTGIVSSSFSACDDIKSRLHEYDYEDIMELLNTLVRVCPELCNLFN